MALCPFAVQKLLPESATQPRIVPRLVILHSAAGKGSLYNFFKNSSNLESHFWVGEDGTIEQYIDTAARADANLKANSFAVSIETESTREATERWNPRQAAAIVRLVGWICDEHRIPKRKVPTWDGSGIGWHIMWGAPGPWTPVSKSCPGPARIVQTRDEIIPAVAGHVASNIIDRPDPGELTMDAAAAARFDAIDKKLSDLAGGIMTDVAEGRGADRDERDRDGSTRAYVFALAEALGHPREQLAERAKALDLLDGYKQ